MPESLEIQLMKRADLFCSSLTVQLPEEVHQRISNEIQTYLRSLSLLDGTDLNDSGIDFGKNEYRICPTYLGG